MWCETVKHGFVRGGEVLSLLDPLSRIKGISSTLKIYIWPILYLLNGFTPSWSLYLHEHTLRIYKHCNLNTTHVFKRGRVPKIFFNMPWGNRSSSTEFLNQQSLTNFKLCHVLNFNTFKIFSISLNLSIFVFITVLWIFAIYHLFTTF